VTDYATLADDIAAFTNREDLGAKIPSFIRLAKNQMDRDIRHWRMENRATLSGTSDRYIARPDDWVETIRLSIDGKWESLELVSTDQMSELRRRVNDAVGEPRFYRHSEDGFELLPSPDQIYQYNLEYMQKIPEIDDTTVATNWVLTNYYDVYLYGCLMHAHIYLMDPQETQTKAALFSAAIKRLNDSGKAEEHSGRSRFMRVRGLGGGGHGHRRR